MHIHIYIYIYTYTYIHIYIYISKGPAARNRHRAFGGPALRGSAEDLFASGW